ncbi:MAG: hypothetical protein H6717_34225 [Polyangiaceae bacterium]|nr:hypothetical protein [Polyangiaceae bacterium]
MRVELGETPQDRYRHWLHPVCAWAALVLPLLVTLWRASTGTQWRDDMAIVRGLGLVPLGGEGTVSSVVMQLFALLPLGGRLLRASLASALALAVAARLVYALAVRLLDENAWTPRLTPLLAFAAALTTTLSPTWQLEGTIAGGATLAACLVLLGVMLRPDGRVGDARVWLGYGAFIAITSLESHAAGAALLVAIAVQVGVLGETPPRRNVGLLAAGALVTAALCLVPLAVRPFAERSWVHLGFGLSATDISAVDTAAQRPGALASWFREIGMIAVALAAVGGVWGVVRGRTRWLAAPLVALVLADVCFPASRAGVLASDPLASVRLLAVAGLGIGAALGVHTLAVGLGRAKIPFAQPAAALLVVFDFTLVLMTGEDSSYVADRRSQNAAEVWTDEALSALPNRSLILVRSQAVAWRLWAARVVRGERPDLVVVPLPLLDKGSVATSLLTMEPNLAPLIREMSLAGKPNEYSLSVLSDTRPLYVELDPSWDRRLVDHMIPKQLWVAFAPHAVGRSDRVAGRKHGRRAFERVLSAASTPTHQDSATLAVLGARAEEQAFALAALGDRGAVGEILADIKRIDPASPFASELEARMKKHRRGRVDVSGLLE